ncbi:aminohydrolase [Microstroma glucosiphilum]|uniref:dihydropyrimidinase n=1 Tax=Pseudomicrostroma glucosiphilum TaxID=1684307 RepID=A0A316U9B4_9BASI|nr:aminohydrolase [Pseudomicrostroma glucosiphilum]PWN21444.1 aminohydrolase [Pseudomicrostroma glucosiphilum]
MPRFDTVIVNGLVVTAADSAYYNIGIKDGKIEALAREFSSADLEGCEIIDAEGAYVMPGGIDGHVHLCQDLKTGPNKLGGRCSDNFETGSRSAAAGGTTTMVNFASQDRLDEADRSLIGVVQRYAARAQSTGSYIDYAFHVIITRNDPDVLQSELPVLVKEWGITSCKLFMTYDTMRLTDRQLLDVMVAARKNSVTTLIHAENGDAIEWLTEQLEARDMIAPYYHALSRPPLIEAEASNRAIALAQLVQNPILFVHIGSPMAAQNVREAQSRGLPIYAETCPQYFNLTWQDLKRFHSPTCFENSKMICSPPPPAEKNDHEALQRYLANGTFTIWSSDHCPFRYDDPDGKPAGVLEHAGSMQGESGDGHNPAAPCTSVYHEVPKEDLSRLLARKMGHFKHVPNGIPGVETRLPLLFSQGLLTGLISPSRFVELTSTNPAKLYGMYPQKGCLMPGSDADLVIWHPQATFKPFALSNSHLHHNVDYTPYEGQTLSNWPRYTMVRGKLIWSNGKIVGQLSHGNFVKRGPNSLHQRPQPFGTDLRNVATWL